MIFDLHKNPILRAHGICQGARLHSGPSECRTRIKATLLIQGNTYEGLGADEQAAITGACRLYLGYLARSMRNRHRLPLPGGTRI